MEKQNLIEDLKQYLREQIDNMKEDVEEAYGDQDGMYSGEYDFGHPQDSFDAGWDRGETVGEFEGFLKVMAWIERQGK